MAVCTPLCMHIILTHSHHHVNADITMSLSSGTRFRVLTTRFAAWIHHSCMREPLGSTTPSVLVPTVQGTAWSALTLGSCGIFFERIAFTSIVIHTLNIFSQTNLQIQCLFVAVLGQNPRADRFRLTHTWRISLNQSNSRTVPRTVQRTMH